MAIRKLDHVSILASDPEPVLDFYGRFLGFEVASRREVPAMKMVIYDLKTPTDFIEVIQQTSGGGRASDGIKHVAFLSDDIEADFADFRERGAPLVHKEVQRHENVSFFFVRGPAGEFVEVIQYA